MPKYRLDFSLDFDVGFIGLRGGATKRKGKCLVGDMFGGGDGKGRERLEEGDLRWSGVLFVCGFLRGGLFTGLIEDLDLS